MSSSSPLALAGSVALTVSFLIAAGCNSRAAAPHVVETIQYQKPILAPKVDGKAEDAGVKVIFSAKANQAKTFTAVTKVEEPFMGNTLILNGQKHFDVTRQSVRLPYPAQDFSARVTNSSTSAVRLSNAVVTYTFNGSVINLDQSRFEKFVKIVVPPQGTAEITIPGVLAKDLGPGELEIGLFDVSVGDKKANFKVVFNVKQENAPIEVTEGVTDEVMTDYDKQTMIFASASEVAGFRNLLANWATELSMYENDSWKPKAGLVPAGFPFLPPR